MKKIYKLFLYILIGITGIMGISQANFDLIISKIYLSNGGDTVALYSEPSINIKIENIGVGTAVNDGPISEGFIKCIEVNSSLEVFLSSTMTKFIIEPDSGMIARNLQLSDNLTETQREVKIKCSINEDGARNNSFTSNETDTSNNTKEFSFRVDKLSRFDPSMNRAIEPIKDNLDAAEPSSTIGGGDSIRSFIFNKIVNVVTPFIIIIGVMVGIIGAYKLFFSDKEEDLKKGVMLVIYGIVGIIIILSARYIGSVIFEDILQSGDTVGLNGADIAQQLYGKIAYPFIKIVLYLALGILFLALAGKTLGFITQSDGSGQKKAITMIARSAISMLIIIGAKQLVEAVYGKQDNVLNQSAQNLGDIGGGILANKNIPIIYTIINRIMGLTALVVLIIIIFQTFQILVNPEKSENRQKLGKTILYIFIGILIIGTGYVITNFLIIN
ncbi:MAG TPA: hypothetical protein PK674_01590 [Candidatus Absconditabacterales bacterium]|nr:hypothetical protein [Candidatus Absconditabacterales bacterium]HOQ78856.1 hypothetical protein [Candidatus Absconditabacterales bacterium]HPK28182.1 hypothetical protein [Candidatus Absconditabacterales bacterium]